MINDYYWCVNFKNIHITNYKTNKYKRSLIFWFDLKVWESQETSPHFSPNPNKTTSVALICPTPSNLIHLILFFSWEKMIKPLDKRLSLTYICASTNKVFIFSNGNSLVLLFRYLSKTFHLYVNILRIKKNIIKKRVMMKNMRGTSNFTNKQFAKKVMNEVN